MMMNFILMTISFAIAILLASVLACAIMFQPKVLKWWVKCVTKMSEKITDELYE